MIVLSKVTVDMKHLTRNAILLEWVVGGKNHYGSPPPIVGVCDDCCLLPALLIPGPILGIDEGEGEL